MSFRQIFDRIARIARAEANGSRSSSYDEELRRAQELIDESRRGRRTSVEEDPDESADERGSSTTGSDAEEYERALRTIGAPVGATREQITAAYRKRARELHPDRVSHPGADEQLEALRRMQDLNRAYEYLRRRFDR